MSIEDASLINARSYYKKAHFEFLEDKTSRQRIESNKLCPTIKYSIVNKREKRPDKCNAKLICICVRK